MEKPFQLTKNGCIFPASSRNRSGDTKESWTAKALSSSATERSLALPLTLRRRARTAPEKAGVPSAISVGDEELLTRVQAGDPNAVGILFDRYASLIFGIGFRVLHDQGEAEDLVQEIFLRLVQRSNTFDSSKGCARTWIVQVAYRRAFDRRTYLRRRCFYNGTDLEHLKNAFQENLNLEEQVAARVTGEQLHTAFEELSERQRATLELFFFDGCNLQEVSVRLGETLENTRHLYYRGLERLRKTAIALAVRGERSIP